MSNTIFDNLINDENTLTEAFKNFLRFPLFRGSVIKMLDLKDMDEREFEYDDFETQISLREFGQPDMPLITDDTEVLIEVKLQIP